MYYTRQRTQRSTFKRRKMLDRHSTLVSEEFANSNAKRTTKFNAREPHAASLEGLFCLLLFCSSPTLFFSCPTTYFGATFLLQQTRPVTQCHSMDLVNQMIAMVSVVPSILFYFGILNCQLNDVLIFLPVKLKIKSFKVPELLIEIPETASVGSLKVFSRQLCSCFFICSCA